MTKWAFILIPLLAISACVMRVGSAVSNLDGNVPRTIDAPRGKVFDVLQDESNFRGFSKVSDTGDRIRYETKLDKATLEELGRPKDSDASSPFRDGTLSMILEPDRLMIVEMQSATGDKDLRFKMQFSDDSTKTKTVVTTKTELKERGLTPEQVTKMETFFNYLAGSMADKVVKQIEQQLG